METNVGSKTGTVAPSHVVPPVNIMIPFVSVSSPVQLVPPFAAGTSISLVLSKHPQLVEQEVQADQEPQVQLTATGSWIILKHVFNLSLITYQEDKY